MPSPIREPELAKDIQFPDNGHWYWQTWFDNQRLLIRAHIFPTRRGFAAATKYVAPRLAVDCHGLCVTGLWPDKGGGRLWLVLDMFFCRPYLRKRPSTLWHEATHVFQQVFTRRGRLPDFEGAGGRLRRDEAQAVFASGVIESLRRWWEWVASAKAETSMRSVARYVAFERLV